MRHPATVPCRGENAAAGFSKLAFPGFPIDRQGMEISSTVEVIRFTMSDSSLGAVAIAVSEDGVCGLIFGESRGSMIADLQRRFPKAVLQPVDDPAWAAKAEALVDAVMTGDDLPLDVRGTDFQQRVWRALREIPSGSTMSYTELARKIGRPQAVRAVAGACASNPIAVAIPCHRIVRGDGALSGYRWGVDKKRALLQREMLI